MSIPDDHGGRVQAVRRELYELRAEVETLRRHDMLGSLVRTGYPIDEQLRRGERALWLSA